MDEKKKQIAEEESVELSVEKLEDVTGAGNPFENIPRVPLQPIDPELREDA